MKTHDFLLELGTEELPPKLLLKLSSALKDNLSSELKKLHIGFDTTKAFATPRRLAITISAIQSKQQEQIIEKKGPSTQLPEMAISGFAKSCGINVNDLEKKEQGGKEYYYFSKEQTGQNISDLLPLIIEKAISAGVNQDKQNRTPPSLKKLTREVFQIALQAVGHKTQGNKNTGKTAKYHHQEFYMDHPFSLMLLFQL